MKIKSPSELKTLTQELKRKLELRLNNNTDKTEILIGMATCGISSGAFDTMNEFLNEIKKHSLNDVDVVPVGCLGICKMEPLVAINMPNTKGVFYKNISKGEVAEIVEKHIIGKTPVEKLLINDSYINIEKQFRIALKNCGIINPEDISEYIAFDGYEGLSKVLTQMSPDDVIKEIKNSGLRGRGGGGFPTGLKWEITKNQTSEEKYIICNADEGDPGAFMDRSILEGDPQCIIEGMAVGAYAIGASTGIIYIRAEYPLAIKRITLAINQAKEIGLIGQSILGTNFNFDILIKYGAGAFVCGEETALINSCEGKRGEPNFKPPYPSENGYFGYSTCVNNVETFANISRIIVNGSKWFSSIGTNTSKGTKVFALTGKINNVGLVEIPMGTTLRDVIFGIGGGIKEGRKFKAVQIGGPSGGVVPEQHIDTPIDYDSLLEIGSMMGSGGMIVMDETDNMVDIAKFYMEFSMDESCGRCTPCRIGTKRLYEQLRKISLKKAKKEDLDKLKTLSFMVKESSLCGLGQTAPNPIISTLKHFYNEYSSLIKD